SPRLLGSYRWRQALRVGGLGIIAGGILILSPLLVLILAAGIYVLALLAALVNLPNLSARLIDLFRGSIEVLFNPPILPTIVPRFVLLALLVVLSVLVSAAVSTIRQERSRRRWRGSFWWHLLGSPLESDEPENLFVDTLWTLVRGASK